MLFKFLIPVLITFLLYGCSGAPKETAPENTEYLAASEIGISGYSCITGESEIQQVNGLTVRAFSHRIYNPNNDYIGTLTATVTGSLSGSDPQITDIRAELSDQQIDGLSVSVHTSENTGTVVLYLNQMSICHFQYRMRNDGQVTYLQS